MASISDDVNSIKTQMERDVARVVLKLHSDLVDVAPVDTGFFKRAWIVEHRQGMNWIISNSAEYTSFLWRGHSKQWNGGDAMLAKADSNLNVSFTKIEPKG